MGTDQATKHEQAGTWQFRPWVRTGFSGPILLTTEARVTTKEVAAITPTLSLVQAISILESLHSRTTLRQANHQIQCWHHGMVVGYNMRFAVTPIDENHARTVVEISRSGGKGCVVGFWEKEVRKILAGIDAELAGQKAGLR